MCCTAGGYFALTPYSNSLPGGSPDPSAGLHTQALKTFVPGPYSHESNLPAAAQVVHRFGSDPAIRVALLSVTAAGTGLDFSAASHVVFAELPPEVRKILDTWSTCKDLGLKRPLNPRLHKAKSTPDEVRINLWNPFAL